MTTAAYPYRLFEVVGVELEHMIVSADTLDVRPIADRLIEAESGVIQGDVERGPVTWSNELAAHVIEMKTTEPVRSLSGLASRMQGEVRRMNELLAPMGARLMPGAMHPWMDPEREMTLWPHEYNVVYAAFDRIFSCRGHGWGNLQSAHINLPFGDDEEFGRLHAALRVLLPILPALAASSPIADGRLTGLLDTRMEVYRNNSRRIPMMAGRVIPEPVFSHDDYQRLVLDRLYGELEPHDPEGILRYEWANARGCIARFDRGAIEIRVIDVQERPAADVAIVAATVAVTRALAEGALADQPALRKVEVEPLADILLRVIRDADQAVIEDSSYLSLLGWRGPSRCSARDLWASLIERFAAPTPEWREHAPAMDVILSRGCLARRIAQTVAGDARRERLHEVYARVCDCMQADEPFLP